MDQDMAILTEMIQTGLYIQELSRILYEAFMQAVAEIGQLDERNPNSIKTYQTVRRSWWRQWEMAPIFRGLN